VGGSFVATLYDYEFAPGVTNYYRTTAVPKGLYLPGAAGSNATSPDNAALDIVGDLGIRADLTMSNWAPGVFSTPVSKWNQNGVNQRGYALQMADVGKIQLVWSNDGTAVLSAQSTIAVPAIGGQRLAIRATLQVNNGAAGRTITFYTAPTIASGAWTQLGTAVVQGGTTSIFNSNSQAQVSGHSGSFAGGADSVAYQVHAVEIRAGIGGTVGANPDFTIQNNLAGSFTDAAGRVWTINGSAQILTVQGPTTIVPTPFERIWLKSTARSFLNQQVTVTDYTEPGRSARAGVTYVDARTLPIAQVELMTGRQVTLDIRTTDLAAAKRWDFLIASGDVLFLQTPAGCVVPSGYFRVDSINATRPWAHGGARYLSLPLVEVAAPGPDIVAAQSTWDSLITQYGSYDALLAAIGTSWDQYYALVGAPSETIVP